MYEASPTDVWAVGSPGIVHYDGSGTTTTWANPTSTSMNSVWGTGTGDVLAVGAWKRPVLWSWHNVDPGLIWNDASI